jgi:N-carbamoylputrescine amidase
MSTKKHIPESKIRIACIRMEPRIGEKDANVARGLTRIEEAAVRHGPHLVAGIAERDGHALYNAAAAVGPDGFVGKYRKDHLWEAAALYFESGNLGMPVFHSDIGRMGTAICCDIWFPETFRLAALQGADIARGWY